MIGPVAEPPASIKFLDKKVVLACPWYRDVHPLTAFSVQQLADKRRTSAVLNWGDAFIVHTRNTIADHFLKSKADWMLTIDSDMVVPFGNADWFNSHTGFKLPEPFCSFNAIDRLLSHNKTLVGALYFMRWPGGKAIFAEGNQPEVSREIRRGPQNAIRPTKWVGTGCMLIHRSVFEDIEKKFPVLARKENGLGGQWFTSSEHNLLASVVETHAMLGNGPMTGEKALRAYGMLEAALLEARSVSNLGAGEDVIFCRRASQVGHQPYVDLGLLCGHIGNTVFGPNNTTG